MMFDDTLISIHAPTRGATILCNHRGLVFGFQSTLPREERLSFPCNISFHLIFQSTLPREERQTMRKLTIAELNFNPRSHERSDVNRQSIVWLWSYFNPRSHERSDHIFVCEFSGLCISIHAPTRGATRTDRFFSVSYTNFNPRSHERSDSSKASLIAFFSYFNPRSHERSDQLREQLERTLKISIHAPTRGATLHVSGYVCAFNPRSHERSDDLAVCDLAINCYFNPRSHERSDSSHSF